MVAATVCASLVFGGLGPSSAPSTGPHVPDRRAQPPISVRQYIYNGVAGGAVVCMLHATRFDAIRVDGQKAETVDQTGQRHLTPFGGWLSHRVYFGGHGILGRESAGSY